MPTQTPNLHLVIYSTSDGETTFNDYWKSINVVGDGTNIDYSAFQIIDTAVGNKQDTLVSGINIKTIGGQSLLGSGDINIDSNENIASEFSSSSTYTIGDLVMHLGLLYECSTDVSVAGDWDANDWTQTKVADIIGNIGSLLITLNSGSGV